MFLTTFEQIEQSLSSYKFLSKNVMKTIRHNFKIRLKFLIEKKIKIRSNFNRDSQTFLK